MTKMYDKKECEYKGGYIVCNGEIVGVDNEIVDLFNQLEEDIQRAEFEAENSNPEVKPAKKFSRKTERGQVYPVIQADTPKLDAKVDEAIALMDEFEAIEVSDKINRYLEKIHPLILFAVDEFIVDAEKTVQHRFDLPTIGDPLKLGKDAIADLVIDMFA